MSPQPTTPIRSPETYGGRWRLRQSTESTAIAPLRWFFWTYTLDVLPLVLLAVVPTGRYWGLDGRASTKLGRPGWPF